MRRSFRATHPPRDPSLIANNKRQSLPLAQNDRYLVAINLEHQPTRLEEERESKPYCCAEERFHWIVTMQNPPAVAEPSNNSDRVVVLLARTKPSASRRSPNQVTSAAEDLEEDNRAIELLRDNKKKRPPTGLPSPPPCKLGRSITGELIVLEQKRPYIVWKEYPASMDTQNSQDKVCGFLVYVQFCCTAFLTSSRVLFRSRHVYSAAKELRDLETSIHPRTVPMDQKISMRCVFLFIPHFIYKRFSITTN